MKRLPPGQRVTSWALNPTYGWQVAEHQVHDPGNYRWIQSGQSRWYVPVVDLQAVGECPCCGRAS